MPRPTATAPGLEKKKELAKLRSQIWDHRLAPSQSPAARNQALEQKRSLVELVEYKDNMALIGTFARVAEQIGFQSCPLPPQELRGALLLVLDHAKDPERVAAFRQRDAAYLASKRRPSIGVRAFVAAAKPSAELSQAAKLLKLRRDDLAGGFAGRAQVSALTELGETFKCTIRIAHGGEQLVLVEAGVIDADVKVLVEMEVPAPVGGEETVVPDIHDGAVMQSDTQQGVNVLPAMGGEETMEVDTHDGAVPMSDAQQVEDELPAAQDESEQVPSANGATREHRFGNAGSRPAT